MRRGEDLATYPRTFAADIAALAKLKVDLVWAPSAATMYPDGFATRIVPEGAAKAGLEDAFRPHFFAGVATVVAKLLIQCEPDFALFGEKDYQQLRVVTQMARDLGLKTRIVGVPTRREADGLGAVVAQPLPDRDRAHRGAMALPHPQGMRGRHRRRQADRRCVSERRPRRNHARGLHPRLS